MSVFKLLKVTYFCFGLRLATRWVGGKEVLDDRDDFKNCAFDFRASQRAVKAP